MGRSAGPTRWTFALNLDITRPEHAGARAPIGQAILGELGALGGVRDLLSGGER